MANNDHRTLTHSDIFMEALGYGYVQRAYFFGRQIHRFARITLQILYEKSVGLIMYTMYQNNSSRINLTLNRFSHLKQYIKTPKQTIISANRQTTTATIIGQLSGLSAPVKTSTSGPHTILSFEQNLTLKLFAGLICSKKPVSGGKQLSAENLPDVI
uniref:Uncharacterized protein n=1 Tax=Romanomermis culicivorax TaxID=13658 RepID=A0A915HGS4_ROMCU